jgi:hypothetical protein
MRGLMRGVVAAGVMLLAGGAAAADKKDEGASFGVSVDASALLGLGISVGIPVGESFNVRGVYHAFKYDMGEINDDSGATYDPELDLRTTGLMADWHPFKGAFRLTAGFMSNGNKINLSGHPTSNTFTVGQCEFESNPADPMGVDGSVEFSSSAPYLGIGWGGNLNGGSGLFATFDVGVMMSGSPDTTLKGRGQAKNANAGQIAQCGDPVNYQDVSSYPEFQQAVQEAEDEVNQETKDYELWPNIALGVGWRF